jgi:hypothetical protein
MTTDQLTPLVTAETIERGQLAPALDQSVSPAREVAGLMAAYFRTWNAKDAEGLAANIYRFGPNSPLQSAADMRALLDRTVAEGWDYSVLDTLDIHPLDGGAFLANGLFTRFTVDGEPLLPVRRPTAYVIREFEDGWRIVDLPLVYR